MTLKNFVVSLIMLASGMAVRAQVPVADFTASRTSGCSPVTVTFTDRSSGNPRFWNWDFGNGQISNQQNPSTTYSAPGTYSVTLVVRNGDGTNGVTRTGYITVSPSPSAAYTQSASIACQPANIQFTDASSTPNGSIRSWQWNFGDGSTSTEQNPSHNFATNGFYSVSLTVADDSGCTSGATYFRNVRVVSGVVAEFANTQPSTCQAPFVVSFRNQTSGPGTLTYSWDFGNGSTSNATSPQVPYSAPGTYTVNLRAVSEFGCSDTVQKTVTFNGIGTNFTSADSSCINSTIGFTNSSGQTPVSSRWYVNDSLFSRTANSSFRFGPAGSYTVKLVNQYADCADSVSRTITILPKPVIDFSAPVTSSCRAPFTVDFTDNTPNAVAWSWTFGGGGTSTQRNPQHVFNTAGSFPVTLAVTDRFGCSDTITRADYIQVVPPTAAISNAPTGGCIPYTYSPIAATTSIDGIASYFWDLGNGQTSTSPTPTTTYPTAGNYDLFLRVTTNGGCSDSVRVVNGVRTGTPPTPNFTVLNPVACAFGPIQFQNTSTGADSYSWNFGDNTTSSGPNPVHNYTDTGRFSVTLTAFNNGCPASVTQNNIVSVSPPVAAFDFTVNCANGTEVTFLNRSKVDPAKGAITYRWSFGDSGGSTSAEVNPIFNYPARGTYTVSLTVTNDTCSHTITRQVQLVTEIADFSINKTPVCKGESFTLTAINSNPDNIRAYEWKIGSDPAYLDNRQSAPTLTIAGDYDLQLTITDVNGCTNTKLTPRFIRVVGPTAGVTVDAVTHCANSLVTFTSTSTSASPISRYRFDFGDGNVRDFTAPPFTHRYTDSGAYTVRLTVTDAAGCTDVAVLNTTIAVSKPVAAFSMDTTTYCPGLPVSFVDSSRGTNLTYIWDFGDGITSSDANPTHVYGITERSYTVKLTVTDAAGCSDSLIRRDFINIRRPKPAFTLSDSVSICPPFETSFTSQATDYESFYWDFGDGSEISLLENPRHFYNSYGTFTAKLYALGAGGCIDSTERMVYVQNPSSTIFNYSPLTACNELNVEFDIQPPSLTRFHFNFGDGAVDTTQSTSFSHLYSSPGSYGPSITLFDRSGCQVGVGAGPAIAVMGAVPLFGVDRNQFCDTGTVYFTNYTIGNDPVVEYRWDLGDGTVSTNTDQIHSYTQPGNYVARLRVTTQMGCVDEETDTINVYRTPVASINSIDTICVNSIVTFQSVLAQADTNTINYSWNFGNGSTSTMRDATVTFTNPGTYTVQLDTRVPFGCNSSTSRSVHVVPLPGVEMPQNLVAISGSGVFINPTYSGPIVSYLWTPSTDLSCYNCPTPYATPKTTKTFRVAVTDRYGCTNSGEATVVVVCNNQNLFIPNTFSPNGDGSNDRFYPRGTGLFRIKALRIFNRWGETVYEKTNFIGNSAADGWDGRYKGKLADPDVYVYSIEIICENGETFPFKGNVMLLR